MEKQVLEEHIYIYNTMATRTYLEGQIVINIASMDIASLFFLMEVIQTVYI